MALAASCLRLLAEAALPVLSRRDEVIVLGHPDIGATTAAELSNIFGVPVETPNFAAALQAVGFKSTAVLDVSAYEGAAIITDLGLPLNRPDHAGRYDLVVDNGTIEHVFDVAQAFLNCKRLCAVGGAIFHLNPLNLVNHGFWNLSPCVYFDFYEANGFDVSVWLRDTTTGRYARVEYKPKVTTIPPARRHTIHAVARKLRDTPDVMPIQRRWAEPHGALALTGGPL